MADHWIDSTVGEQATLQRGIDITRVEQRAGTVPVISSGGVSSYHDTPAARGPGVVLGRKGVVGSVYFVPSDYWPHDTTLWVKDFHGNDARFVYYFFRWIAPRIATMDVGSANPTLNRNHVHPIAVRWPPPPQQRAIAGILGALDDRIELNRRSNETLEAMARAIFKSWFVDLDPVRTKAKGRQPAGMDAETAALFPDSFEESGRAATPLGWRTRTVSEVCEGIFSGGTPRTESERYWQGGIPWLSSGETRSKFIVSTERTITPAGVAESRTRHAAAGLTVVAGAGQGRTRGQTSMLLCETYINQSVVALAADETQVSRTYLFFDLERRYEEFRRISDGHSSRGSLTTRLLGGLPIVVPERRVIEAFDALAKPLTSRIATALRENQSLVALRDALLPKLLSGEVRVNDGESILSGPA